MPPDAPAASDADRDRVAAALGAHYAAGRLELSELDGRLARALAARTLPEADAALDGLPPLPAATKPSGRSRWRRGRHGESDRPQPGWIPTLERFRDPSTGRVMRVWTDPADGSRRYLPDSI